jgi:hypothetical protein
MRITYDSYTDDDFWNLSYDSPPDYSQVASDYQYAWAYGTPEFSSGLATVGDRIYSYGALEVYKLRQPPPAP